MSRTNWDVLRSVGKYMAVCAPDWEVRFDDDAVTFPYMRVGHTTPITYSGSAYLYNASMGVEVALYPGEKKSVEAANETGGKIQGALQHVFRFGYGRGWPMRIPLYDFDGLSLAEAAPENARYTRDYLRITDFTSVQLPDPSDRRRMAVVANIRLSWRAVGAVPSGSQTVNAVTATPSSVH